MGLFRIWRRAKPTPVPSQPRPIPREMRFAVVQPNRPQPPDTVVRGRCWVIDGDTIAIDNMHIRLAGIDAPELDHPWGQQSKWTMVKLCKGQTITAHVKADMSYNRIVAECFLPDGRDLAAELVKAGLALDWPKFSGGKYRHLEPPDARQKLWRAQLRQRGLKPPGGADKPASFPTRSVGQPPEPPHTARRTPIARNVRRPQVSYRVGWLSLSGVVVLLVGCNFIGGDEDQSMSAVPTRQASALTGFEVTASVLNVRKQPAEKSGIIAQIGKGTRVIPTQVSGIWYGIEMPDGSTGWVHGDFLARPAE